MGEDKGTDAESELERLLTRTVGLGASFADARYQSQDNEVITVENKSLKSYSSRKLCGVGIRVVVKGSVGFASTSDLKQSNLEETLQKALKAARSTRREEQKFTQTHGHVAERKSQVKNDPVNVAPEEKVSVTLDANKAAWISNAVKNTTTMLGLNKDFRLYMSTWGAKTNVETTMVGFAHSTVAQTDGVMEDVFYTKSQCAGYEFVKSTDWGSFTGEISKLAIEAAGSKTATAGTFPVVVEPETFGVILHEAFGHATEGDLVFTGASVLQNKKGNQIASENVTVVDEGVIEGGYYYPFDDEGVEKNKTIIVENGVLKNYLLDRHFASQIGSESTGNGRAQDFENLPIVRQTNLYLQPRDFKLEELIEDVDFGLYIEDKGLKGGQVDPGMGTFTFGVGPSKVIRKGELAESVRGVVISGSILDTLNTVDGVGKELKMMTSVFGGCGKLSQRAWVGLGGPLVRVRKMTVGGM